MSIDVPNGTQTEVNWINPSGQMVGDYMGVDGRFHGYLLSGGKFTTIDYPGTTKTFAFGISASGDIVGIQYVGNLAHGYLLTKHGDFSSIDFPGAAATFASMIDGKSIVGFYLDTPTGPAHSYLLNPGNYQPVNCPGWDPAIVTGLNPKGEMTGGGITLADGLQHGLVVSGSQCILIDFPGSIGFNYVNSINSGGDMVGTYQTPDGNGHGYLRTKH